MANYNVTRLVGALTTPRGRHLRGGEPSPAPPRVCDCFTDTELAAAKQLVLLSESSSEDVAVQAASRSSSASSSSTFPSVTNAALPRRAPGDSPVDEDDEEGISGVPGNRRRRYRSIRGLYEATSPIGGGGESRGEAQRGEKNS